MFFHQEFIPGLAIASYVIGDDKTKEVAIIDPTRDIDRYIDLAKRQGFRIRHVFETHVHADFVSGSAEFKDRLGEEVKIHVSGMGGAEWTPPYADHVVKDGEKIHMGDICFEAVHTPGHTLEHMSWALYDKSRSEDTPWVLFTGDFLFVGDVGRPDLLGKEAMQALGKQLYSSVFERLPKFEDFIEIFPGHGEGSLCGKAIGSRRSSTLGYERKFNVSLKEDNEQPWIDNLLSRMPIAPPYFARMKKVNSGMPKILGTNLPGQRRFTAKEVYAHACEDCLIVDVRSKEAFAGAHIPGSINIPLGANLPVWAGWVLPYDTPTLIVLDNPDDMKEVVTHLIRVGFDEIQGYLEDGIESWENHGYDTSTLKTISVKTLSTLLDDKPFILDVRTEREWNSGHIKGAHHIHGGLLQDRIDEVPKDRPVVVVCGSGYRGSIAASFLKRAGYEDVSNLLGGMSAWKAAGNQFK
ncbi:MAG: MBL fold metallo-hydrolase [Phycisphaeraceae bacterium]|nr:MBL fold metallo-hydrolase [Phycisphaeraceae bacterium]